MRISKLFKSTHFKVAALLSVVALMFFIEPAFAGTAPAAIKLASLTKSVGSSINQMSRILSDVALIAGICFILASFFKFHQHKLNPTQVPISQGVTLLIIGACLTVFVLMLPTATEAVFGSKNQMAKLGGSEISALVGGGSGS